MVSPPYMVNILISRCPDGTSILTTSEDRVLRLIDTYVTLHLLGVLCSDDFRPAGSEPETVPNYRSYGQPDAIHATVWYPSASLSHPETFCFAASIRDTPVRLIDATDGRVSNLTFWA